MTLFSYSAINDDDKEVRGTIDAPDLHSAREAVERLHLEVKEVYEANHLRNQVQTELSPPVHVSKTIFSYEGTDDSGQVQNGTLEAAGKREAFERLKNEKKLFLNALSPAGITPPYRDYDLINWQKNEIKSSIPSPPSPETGEGPGVRTPAEAPIKPLGFSAIQNQVPSNNSQKEKEPASDKQYYPLTSTLRLYAGWLLAWYCLFVALGYYSHFRSLPLEIPFVEAFFLSPLIFNFVIAIFIFLMFTALNRILKGNRLTGAALTLVGIAAVVFVRMNV